MRCKHYAPEISLALDGRLPARRRSALHEHLARCTACRRELDAAKAAQALVLGLPATRVGPDFRKTLWERIESGEGAPATPPPFGVTLATKVRWLLTGAAAAAAAIVLVDAGLRRHGGEPPETPESVVAHDPAPAGPGAPVAGMRAPGMAAFGGEAVPLEAQAVARTTARAVAENTAQLQRLLRRVETRTVPLKQFRVELQRPVDELRASARMMRLLHEKQIIELTPTWIEQLPRIEDSIAGLAQADNMNEIGLALRPLASVKAEELQNNFRIWCCDQDRVLLELIPEIIKRDRNVRGWLRVVVRNDNLEPGKPPQVFVLRGIEPAAGAK
jgi:hypothetical protein